MKKIEKIIINEKLRIGVGFTNEIFHLIPNFSVKKRRHCNEFIIQINFLFFAAGISVGRPTPFRYREQKSPYIVITFFHGTTTVIVGIFNKQLRIWQK